MQLSDPPSAATLAGGSPPGMPAASREPSESPAGRGSGRPAGWRRRPVTERIACWSARHRIIALAGWLVMVGGALLAGQVYGTQSQPQYDPGQSGVAERMLHQLHVVSPPSESVLIQSRAPAPAGTLTAAPALTGHVREAAGAVVAALRALPGAATDIQSPFGPGGRHLIGPGGSSALVTFQVAGPHSQADARVVRALAAVAAIQSRYPDLIVAETGSASVDRAATAMLGRDFHQAELTSVPLTLLLLLLDLRRADRGEHPGDPGRNRGDHDGLAAGDPEPVAADRPGHVGGRAHHRDGGRHRLHAVLPAARARRARGGRDVPRRAQDRGRDVRPGDRGVGPDRDDLAGRTAVHGHRHVHRLRDRHHDGGRRGRGRLAHRAASPARAARPVGGPGQGPVPRQGQDAGRAIQAVACRGRPRGQAACRLGRRRAARARRARRPRTRDADRQPRHQPAVEPARGADARGDPARLPWRSSTRPGRRGRARRAQPGHAPGDHRHRSGSGGRRPGARAGDRPARRPRQRPADLGAARGHRGRRQLEPRRRSRDCERCAATSCLARSARSAGSATP